MHVAPLYRLYSAKSHVFVSGMRGAAFISTGRGKAGHSEGWGGEKETQKNNASSKWGVQARAEGRTGGQKMCNGGQNSG